MKFLYVEAMGSYDVYQVGFVGDTHVPRHGDRELLEDHRGYVPGSLHYIHHIRGYRGGEVVIHYGVYPIRETENVDDTDPEGSAYSPHPDLYHVMVHHDHPMHYFQLLLLLQELPVAYLAGTQEQRQHSYSAYPCWGY